MNMKKILTAAAILVSAVSFGQNINPTVEVTNTYQGNPSEVHKPQLGMAVPDSLLRFDMDFGYEVFEKPYQGAYNFKPYMLAMKPDKDAYRGRKLYLRAGAGYSLHPQLDFVFSPEQTGPFQMSVYAGHRSYFGKYNALQATSEDNHYKVDKIVGKTFGGYDALTSAGLDGRYNFGGAILSFGIGYEGLMNKDSIAKRSFNAADLNVRVRSNKAYEGDIYLYYDVAADARFGMENRKVNENRIKDNLNPFFTFAELYDTYVAPGVGKNLNETMLSIHGEAGPVLSETQAIIMGFEAATCSYRNLIDDKAGKLAVVPSYRIKTGPWDFNLGVRVEKMLLRKPADDDYLLLHQYKGSTVFPAVKVSYKATDNILLYASATGGNDLNPYSSLLSRHHFLTASTSAPLMDVSTEKVNARIGAKGNLGSTMQFEVDGGAAVYANGLLDSGVPVWDNSFLPSVVYNDYSLLYADAIIDLKAGDFCLDGGLHLRHSALKEDGGLGLMLPTFSTDLRAVYNFSPRIYAGVNLLAATSRKGFCKSIFSKLNPEVIIPDQSDPLYEVAIPGYIDLGLSAGYRFNRKLSFWLESGNLLCESIQRNPFYAEKDLWITAGITLNL